MSRTTMPATPRSRTGASASPLRGCVAQVKLAGDTAAVVPGAGLGKVKADPPPPPDEVADGEDEADGEGECAWRLTVEREPQPASTAVADTRRATARVRRLNGLRILSIWSSPG